MTTTRASILDALKAKAVPLELPGGVQVRIREMSVRERLQWRRECMQGEELSDDWALWVVQHCTLLPDSDEQLWASVAEVDGTEAVLSVLIREVLQVNGLREGAVREAAEDFPQSQTGEESTS